MGSFDRSSTEVRHTGNLLISYTRYYQILKTVYGKGAKKNKENNIARIAKLPYGQRKALLKVNLYFRCNCEIWLLDIRVLVLEGKVYDWDEY